MGFKFSNICQLLEDLEEIAEHQPQLSPEHRNERSKNVIVQWFTKHRKGLKEPTANGPAILSILLPGRRLDMVYGKKEDYLSKKIPLLLQFHIAKKIQLLKYKKCGNGDLASCLQGLTRVWDGSIKPESITVTNILELLEQLAARCRFSSASIRAKLKPDINIDTFFRRILIRLRSWEIKWLLRVILRNLSPVALDEHTLLREYHFLLPDILQFRNDFSAAFALLQGPLCNYDPKPDVHTQSALKDKALKYFCPVVGTKVKRPDFQKAWSWKDCFNRLGQRLWFADLKYDGEYCEIHVDLDKGEDCIQIFSKSGKDSTEDRRGIHNTIKESLQLGKPGSLIKHKCIVLGELVVYSDKEKKILEFHHLRKHVTRSGFFMGTALDSLPQPEEHLMIVYFDVLMVDEDVVMWRGLDDRRAVLRELVKRKEGRAIRSEYSLLDFRSSTGAEDLKNLFARALATRQEGFVLKPAFSPYFRIRAQHAPRHPNFYVKLKKDHLVDMGGSKDVGDFAVIGARYNAQRASKTGRRNIRYTDFYLGCLTNKSKLQDGEKPNFKVVAVLKAGESCIPTADLDFLNQLGQFYAVEHKRDQVLKQFDVIRSYGYEKPMEVAFREPFVVEVLGSGYEVPSSERFFMLRHPRILKIHRDRTWKEDTVCMQELRQMAQEARGMPSDESSSDGIGADVFARVAIYQRLHTASQETERTTQRTTPRSSQVTPRASLSQLSTSPTITGFSVDASSTQGLGVRASRNSKVAPILVRADTDVLLESVLEPERVTVLPTPPESSAEDTRQKLGNKRIQDEPANDTSSKRPRNRSPLADAQKNGSANYNTTRRAV